MGKGMTKFAIPRKLRPYIQIEGDKIVYKKEIPEHLKSFSQEVIASFKASKNWTKKG